MSELQASNGAQVVIQGIIYRIEIFGDPNGWYAVVHRGNRAQVVGFDDRPEYCSQAHTALALALRWLSGAIEEPEHNPLIR